VHITLLPEIRGRRIGALVIQELMKEADHEYKSISIYVESFNGLWDYSRGWDL
jgi:hypothetical protein